MATLADLTAVVAQQATVDASIEKLVTGMASTINDLKAQLASAGGLNADQQAIIDKAVADITAANAGIQAAVTANTPAAPEAAPAPAPAPEPAPAPAAPTDAAPATADTAPAAPAAPAAG